MVKPVNLSEATLFGLSLAEINKINGYLFALSPELAWQKITKEILIKQPVFQLHLYLFKHIFPHWPAQLDSAPAWIPERIMQTNLGQLMQQLEQPDVKHFHAWSVAHYPVFWQVMLEKLQIIFHEPARQIVSLREGIEHPTWLVGAKLNIAESCFMAMPDKIAIIFPDSQGTLHTVSYAALNNLSNRVANGLGRVGIKAQDKIAIAMPMTVEAVAIYLGIIKMGAIVVPIADSFSAEEIAMRLHIAPARFIFTQDYLWRNAKQLPLYEKIIAAQAPPAILLSFAEKRAVPERAGDICWQDFLATEEHFVAQSCDPMAACTILFSSGTTGIPKAIPWNHTTAIKAASDAYLHQNIQPDDVLAWPTNLGWMMGPWLIFAAFINQATLALYPDAPTQSAFGQFIQEAKVTMLGVVPSLVAHWRANDCMAGLDWQAIRVLSSTGECSNPEDMLYLMFLAGYKPIIEYCGGTEIGGSYISSTVIEKNYPSVLTTPAMGSDFILLDEAGQPTAIGEVALIPPILGLSTELLNTDHHTVYYADMPQSPAGKILRRHGDQIRRLPSGYYCMLGRTDDTMNLGGIKVSAAEIERVLVGLEGITEVAAVAKAEQGPSRLVIYAVSTMALAVEEVKKQMQLRINQQLNPLFKIHEVVVITELPKTASNKIKRGVLRKPAL